MLLTVDSVVQIGVLDVKVGAPAVVVDAIVVVVVVVVFALSLVVPTVR